MFRTAAIALAIAIAAPAGASDQLARSLKVEPGAYTLNEMVQLMGLSSVEREQRIEQIHRQREAFRKAVQNAMNGSGVYSTQGTTPQR
jgi:hypothetical protein